jgi:superfamily I DNA and RNA helicase
MFSRPLFVTNSSSSSHIVYGVKLDRSNLEKLVDLLAADPANKTKIDDEIKNFYLEENLPKDSVPLAEQIAEMDEWEYLLNDILPEGIEIIRDYDENDHVYLDLSGSLASKVIDGRVVLVDISADAYNELVKLAKSVGVKSPDPNLHTWVTYG